MRHCTEAEVNFRRTAGIFHITFCYKGSTARRDCAIPGRWRLPRGNPLATLNVDKRKGSDCALAPYAPAPIGNRDRRVESVWVARV